MSKLSRNVIKFSSDEAIQARHDRNASKFLNIEEKVRDAWAWLNSPFRCTSMALMPQ
jgi:hypothetical protein